jgi:hypothetical protein
MIKYVVVANKAKAYILQVNLNCYKQKTGQNGRHWGWE